MLASARIHRRPAIGDRSERQALKPAFRPIATENMTDGESVPKPL
ncbi:hypothetical protein [Oxynema sp. CENA135]|nr:hypothetical protein [Oxynema sp. CENA135]